MLNTASKSWRLRFSLRTSIALLTITCVLLASWRATKLKGTAKVAETTGRHGHSPGPFVVAVDLSNNIQVTRQYYLWLFGPVVRVPFQRTYPEPDPIILGGVQPHIIIQLEEDEDPLGITN